MPARWLGDDRRNCDQKPETDATDPEQPSPTRPETCVLVLGSEARPGTRTLPLARGPE